LYQKVQPKATWQRLCKEGSGRLRRFVRFLSYFFTDWVKIAPEEKNPLRSDQSPRIPLII
jgi:hypothetical protein